MAIIDSVRKLAEKVGADTNGRTIADQLNIINQKLDNTQPGSRDISEAVSKFADKEDGTAILITKTITENNTYKASDDGASGYSSVTVEVPSAPVPETFEVEIGYDPTSPSDFTTNKSYDMVKAAIQANKVIKFIWSIKQQGEVVVSGTTSAVDYNSEADFMTIATSSIYADKTAPLLFLWGNPETYTHVSKGVASLFDELQ